MSWRRRSAPRNPAPLPPNPIDLVLAAYSVVIGALLGSSSVAHHEWVWVGGAIFLGLSGAAYWVRYWKRRDKYQTWKKEHNR